ncbi:MAG: hypothetical protein JW951_02435 [Lentisphaerae bacterium]|nr:hypothetical protein [Lentisphaerota bacterium]
MSSSSRYTEWLPRAAALAAALACVAGTWLALRALDLPSADTAPAPGPAVPAWAAPGDAAGADWSVFRGRGGGDDADAAAGALSSRFRLAGTFFAFEAEAGESRKAILDILGKGIQAIVAEGDTVDGVEVARVFREGVVLREGAREEQLWLSFSQRGGSREAAGGGPGEAGGPDAGAADRFGGRRIGPNRWVFSRAALMDYYRELMDDPERLVAVFDSLKPLYDEDNRISGYTLGVEGEETFFDAVGLREGDIVRSVNSMKMTNRRRAEYFIEEFVNDRANAFVLDVERDGTQEKLIYQVR